MREPPLSLPDLAPPPGGLARLRNSVEAPHRRLGPSLAGFSVAACGVVVLALALLPGTLQRYRARTAITDAVRQALQPTGPGEIRVVDGAALALESGQSGVRLYLVQSTSTGEGPAQP